MPSISPEYWHIFSFGKLIDVYGGKSSPLTEMEFEPLRYQENTSLGYIECSYLQGRFSVVAEDLGVALLYGRDGKLDDVSVNLIDFCLSMQEEEFEKMGGDGLLDMLTELDDAGKNYIVNFNLKEKFVAIAYTDMSTGKYEIPALAENVNFEDEAAIDVEFGNYSMFWVAKKVEDEFSFATKTLDYNTTGLTPKLGQIPFTKVLSDCNYQTFLESKATDKLERLARRIFLDS